MNNRSGGPRSFNTVKRSNREERLKRRRQCGKTLLAIFIVSLLLVLSAFILLVCNVAVGIHNRNAASEGGNNEPDTPNLPSITYQVSTQRTAAYQTGDLIVVNSSHKYLFPDEVNSPNTSPAAYMQRVDSKEPYQIRTGTQAKLQTVAAERLNALLTEYYKRTGIALVVYDTYRTEQQQAEGGYSVNAGYSEHHTGLLVSLSESHSTYNLKLEDHSMLFEMCHEYGFIQRYPTGKSTLTGVSNYGECLRYVGVAHATYIYQNGLCLEEYVELLRKNHVSTTGTDGKQLLIDTDQDGTANYAVYYVPKNDSSDLTSIPVPNGIDYTISGDNIGGFIVTVTLNP